MKISRFVEHMFKFLCRLHFQDTEPDDAHRDSPKEGMGYNMYPPRPFMPPPFMYYPPGPEGFYYTYPPPGQGFYDASLYPEIPDPSLYYQR